MALATARACARYKTEKEAAEEQRKIESEAIKAGEDDIILTATHGDRSA